MSYTIAIIIGFLVGIAIIEALALAKWAWQMLEEMSVDDLNFLIKAIFVSCSVTLAIGTGLIAPLLVVVFVFSFNFALNN